MRNITWTEEQNHNSPPAFQSLASETAPRSLRQEKKVFLGTCFFGRRNVLSSWCQLWSTNQQGTGSTKRVPWISAPLLLGGPYWGRRVQHEALFLFAWNSIFHATLLKIYNYCIYLLTSLNWGFFWIPEPENQKNKETEPKHNCDFYTIQHSLFCNNFSPLY